MKNTFEYAYATRCINPVCFDDYNITSDYIGPVDDNLIQTCDYNDFICREDKLKHELVSGVFKTNKYDERTNEFLCSSQKLDNVFKEHINDYDKSFICFNDGSCRYYPSEHINEVPNVHTETWYHNTMFAKRSIVIIFDMTGSIAFNNYYNKQLELVTNLLQFFVETDRIGLVLYNANIQTVDINFATNEQKSLIIDTITNNIPIRNAVFIPSLNTAYNMLINSTTILNSIIVISDGKFWYDIEPTEEIINEIKYDNITIHTMTVANKITDTMKIIACKSGGALMKFEDGWVNMLEIFEAESGETILITTLMDNKYISSIVVTDINYNPPKSIGVVGIVNDIFTGDNFRNPNINSNGDSVYTFKLEGVLYRIVKVQSLQMCELDNLRDNKCNIDQCDNEIITDTCLEYKYNHKFVEYSNIYDDIDYDNCDNICTSYNIVDSEIHFHKYSCEHQICLNEVIIVCKYTENDNIIYSQVDSYYDCVKKPSFLGVKTISFHDENDKSLINVFDKTHSSSQCKYYFNNYSLSYLNDKDLDGYNIRYYDCEDTHCYSDINHICILK